jgi:glycerophosphoryl diester phosphodiesterase
VKLSRRQFLASASTLALSSIGLPASPAAPSKLHTFDTHSAQDLKDFFHYTRDRIPFLSSHRGGARKGFPENCIATFENTLRHTYSMMEIDPHYTKDGAIILMHDPTLDRTSTGHGKISDYTVKELRKLKLKDPQGNVTPYGIPTLDEALEWARGKTILDLDQKDVPIEARIRKIEEHGVEANAMVMAYTFADAQKAYQMNRSIMMEVFIPDRRRAEEFDKTGVAWSNVMAFVTHYQPKDPAVFGFIHERGTMCERGTSRTVDKEYLNRTINRAQLASSYRQIVASGTDIIEANLGIEAGETLERLWPSHSSKQKYFRTIAVHS